MGVQLDTREEQLAEILERLYDEYPNATISLNFSTRHELLIAVMLSAQCTDERVNKETEHLFEKYQSVSDFANADVDELAEDLNSITYYNNKAKWINSACQTIIEEHDGEVPDTMSELTDLTGVGRKTANVVLQHGHDVVEGIVVDTHVQRLSRRLGLTEEKTPQKIETDLMTFVDEEDWQWLTHLFISHGRATCTARNPDCDDCVLQDICPSSKLDNDVDLASGEAWG
ncbi:DNA-(apurinic or apyrimidinic site) lyase /endonuclease III [Haladaptatus litoreus]|uniref:Endonuclease III n=1 Tax=Haladaptatus litoreus TaxID=553468 RepID=A0A1N6XC43_9EURY|nr:endonuclease III [Haladaptatus litoreus]SIQ99905.1 DNA-(apurinic or apyrimidinic site) lyase /endonuclease III [Haladaptatus litoreus]